MFLSVKKILFKQLKYLERDEFKDLKNLRRLHLDRNQLSVVVDNLFNQQKSLEFLGKILWLKIIYYQFANF